MTARAAVAGGYVPPFRSEERRRMSAGAAARVGLAPRVELGAEWAWLSDRTPDGTVSSGPGDLQLGTVVRLVRLGDVEGSAGWSVKLPDASDEGELGTDETDIDFGATARWAHGPWSGALSVGLGIWGNPLRFANQDDVPLLRASVGWCHGDLAVLPALSVDLATARNPGRTHGGAIIRYGAALFVQGEGWAGLTPADADWSAGLAVGYRARGAREESTSRPGGG